MSDSLKREGWSETPEQQAARHDTFNGQSAADAYNKTQANAGAQAAGGAAAAAQPKATPQPEANCDHGIGCRGPIIYSRERQRELAEGRKAFIEGVKFVVGDNPVEIASNFAGGPLGRVVGKVGGKVVMKYGDDVWDAGSKAFSKSDEAVDANRARKRSDQVSDCAMSFGAATPVLMADGTLRAISEVQVGDWVTATDPVTGQQSPRQVLAVWRHDDTLVNLTIGGEALVTTEDHPFWNQSDLEWQDAADLVSGDSALTADGGTVAVGGLDPASLRQGRAYNLTVEGVHTYHVGTASVLVHNANQCRVVPNFNEGIYVVTKAGGPNKGKQYVGQSGNISRRMRQHVRAGKFTQAEANAAARIPVPGGKTKREVAEQKLIDTLGGLKGGNLLNKVNPVGDKRIGSLMPPGYTR